MTPALLLLQAAPPAADSYLADFLRTLLALAGVLALSWFGLRQLARRGFGRPGKDTGPVHVIARVPLEARKSLYVVRAGKRVLLLGTGESGAPALITELDPTTIPGSGSDSDSDSGSGSGSGSDSDSDSDSGSGTGG